MAYCLTEGRDRPMADCMAATHIVLPTPTPVAVPSSARTSDMSRALFYCSSRRSDLTMEACMAQVYIAQPGATPASAPVPTPAPTSTPLPTVAPTAFQTADKARATAYCLTQRGDRSMADCMAQTYVGGPTPAPTAAAVTLPTAAPAAVLPSADFPLILDGMSWSRMEREQPALTRVILGLQWVADGVTENENLAVLYLGHIGRADASLAERILTFPWLNDGATFDTSFFLNQFWKISEQDTSLAHRIVGLPWVADGLTDNEIVKLADVRRITLGRYHRRRAAED